MQFIVRTTLERTLHKSFNQISYSLLIDKNHEVDKIFISQLESISNDDVVLMEDDIILCENFKERVEEIIDKHKKEIINFFSYPFIYIQSGYKNFSYNQCTYYPKEILQDIVRFYKEHKKPFNKTYPEDYIAHYLYAKNKNTQVYNYRPCLVQHIDDKSLLNKHPVSKPRRTIYFIDYLTALNINYIDADTEENREKLTNYMKGHFKTLDYE